MRKAKYDLDSDEVKQYLQLDKLREAMFFVAGELFDFEFTPVPEGSVPVFHEDVRVWEVTDKTRASTSACGTSTLRAAGQALGRLGHHLPQPRDLRRPRTVLGSNNSNFIKGAPGEPVLISWDDAETLFHEFGHALHFLSSERRLSDAQRRGARLHRVPVADCWSAGC